MPLLSIIIPTFNSENTLVRCLESIVAQIFRDFEVVVMDGLSSDATVSIAESFRDKLPQLLIKSDKDTGVYDAMNKGIALANGEWVYFLGSDDELYNKDVLADVFIKNEEVISANDFVYGNVNSTLLGNGYDGEFDIVKIFFKNICHQAIFYKKNIFNKLGAFNLQYPIWADWEFNIRCFGCVDVKTKWLDIVVANYAEGGISQESKDQIFESNIYLIFDSNIKIEDKKYIFKLLLEEHYSLPDYKSLCSNLEINNRDITEQNKGLHKTIVAMTNTKIWKIAVFLKNILKK